MLVLVGCWPVNSNVISKYRATPMNITLSSFGSSAKHIEESSRRGGENGLVFQNDPQIFD